MCQKIQGITIKQIPLTAELVKISNKILVHNIESEDSYDVDDLTFYFNSEKSGGSDVEDVQLIGKGKAIITFADPKGEIQGLIQAL